MMQPTAPQNSIAEPLAANQAGRPMSGGGLPVLDAHAPDGAARGTIHRRFFLAGIVVALTFGAGWGVWLLLRIASSGSFTTPSVFAVNAHGQAQIYGWVGLFILGFAYQAFPRFAETRLALAPIARLSFVAMLGGVVLRSLTEPLAPSPWAWLAIAGAGLELAAVLMFAAVVGATFRSAGREPRTFDRYILAAAAWFVVAGGVDLFHLARLLAAPDREALLGQIATFQLALRDLQIHGVAMMMIFGVSLRVFPNIVGGRPPSDRLARRLWLPLNLAIAAEVAAFVGFMSTKAGGFAVLAGTAIVVLAGATVAFALNLRLFQSSGSDDRSLKLLRASHVWLMIAMAMLVGSPLWFQLVGTPFSHAWYGAMRHAITVGFISMTIMGVAARVVPAMAGVHPSQLSRLWAPFLLVNAGCALRVAGQVATDLSPAAFPIAGASGLLELSGLAVWGLELARVLLGRIAPLPVATTPAPTPEPVPAPPAELDLDASVSDWVRRNPSTLAVFARLGMDSCCGGAESVVNAATHNGVDLEALRKELARHVS